MALAGVATTRRTPARRPTRRVGGRVTRADHSASAPCERRSRTRRLRVRGALGLEERSDSRVGGDRFGALSFAFALRRTPAEPKGKGLAAGKKARGRCGERSASASRGHLLDDL